MHSGLTGSRVRQVAPRMTAARLAVLGMGEISGERLAGTFARQ